MPTVEELREYLGITATGDDGLLDGLLRTALAIIEARVDRRFMAVTETRTFDAPDGDRLDLGGDLLEIVTVALDEAAVTDYVTSPRGSGPFYALRRSGVARWAGTATWGSPSTVTITGRWGYSESLPDDIRHAVLRLAAFLYRQKDTSADLDRPLMAESGHIILPGRFPADVAAIVDRYRKVSW